MNSAVISKSTTNFISRIPAFGFLIALLVLVYLTSASAQTNAPITARDFFNAGTRLLGEKKYTEAEKMFQTALTIQDEHIQPPSLYNVGHARFAAGMERLKKGPDAQKAGNQGRNALVIGDQVIHDTDLLLTYTSKVTSEPNSQSLPPKLLEKLVDSYFRGRGARRNLREAEKALSAAMETYGKTLEQWQRASDDFKGAAEMAPTDTNALYNAKVVDQGIARLLDSIHKMQEMLGLIKRQKQDLAGMMAKIKGMVPAPNAPPGMNGEDDEDDQGMKPEMLTGQKEKPSQEGDQMQTLPSPDQAEQLLNGLPVDGTRRLEMSGKEGKPLKDNKGHTW
mgnify:CR=1 FL=1